MPWDAPGRPDPRSSAAHTTGQLDPCLGPAPPPVWEHLRRVSVEQLGLLPCSAVVDQPSFREHPHRRIEDVIFAASRRQDVNHSATASYERVCYELTVAAPGHRLCAHQGRGAVARQGQKLGEGLREFRCFHVVGVGTEAGVRPVGMGRVGARFRRPPKPGR